MCLKSLKGLNPLQSSCAILSTVSLESPAVSELLSLKDRGKLVPTVLFPPGFEFSAIKILPLEIGDCQLPQQLHTTVLVF